MTSFSQLTIAQRYQISGFVALGLSLREMARRLHIAASTVSRELRRNKNPQGDYVLALAQTLSDQRRRAAPKATKVTDARLKAIAHCLKEGWSPEQISGYLRLKHAISVSHEWVCQQILKDKAQGGQLYRLLPQGNKKYRKRFGSHDTRGCIPGRVDISERPAIVDARSRFGDWEGDTIVGSGHSAIATFVERMTGLLRMKKVSRPTAVETAQAAIERLNAFTAHTLTVDNGREFCAHQMIAKELGTQVYFARPYHSWERGTNENTNGLIRRFFPKGTNFDAISDEAIQLVEDKLNTRPRKRLGYYSPAELLDESWIRGCCNC